jgi:hypothetical protein
MLHRSHSAACVYFLFFFKIWKRTLRVTMPVPRCQRVSRAAWPLAGSAWNFKVELQLRQAPARPADSDPPLPADRDSAAPTATGSGGQLEAGAHGRPRAGSRGR